MSVVRIRVTGTNIWGKSRELIDAVYVDESVV